MVVGALASASNKEASARKKIQDLIGRSTIPCKMCEGNSICGVCRSASCNNKNHICGECDGKVMVLDPNEMARLIQREYINDIKRHKMEQASNESLLKKGDRIMVNCRSRGTWYPATYIQPYKGKNQVQEGCMVIYDNEPSKPFWASLVSIRDENKWKTQIRILRKYFAFDESTFAKYNSNYSNILLPWNEQIDRPARIDQHAFFTVIQAICRKICRQYERTGSFNIRDCVQAEKRRSRPMYGYGDSLSYANGI